VRPDRADDALRYLAAVTSSDQPRTEDAGAGSPLEVRHASFDELPVTTLYDILQLRSAIFVVEQQCVFLDADGRDHEAGAVHVWIEERPTGRVLAYLRIVDAAARGFPGEVEIGRIVVRADRRGEGLADRLVAEALRLSEGPVRLNAQARLSDWYESLGFAVTGAGYILDGIAHVPMRLLR
jgi:ElaA protein